jgi:prepilin-type processing-associated H-X9-DG protein
MLLPALAAAKRKAQKINCTSNLKQVGLSFKLWQGDNNDQMPMAVPNVNGGAFDNVGHQAAAPTSANVAQVFNVMTTQLSNPKVVWCPSDSNHSFTNAWPVVTASISYFVNGDAVDSAPQCVLAGDDSISTGTGSHTSVGAPTTVRFTGATQYKGNPIWTWTSTDMHQGSGNLLLGDGSVQGATLTTADQAFVNGAQLPNGSTPNYSFF